jgi:hypothetical protein
MPALVALVVVAFSLTEAPRALRAQLPAEAFDEARAFGDLRELAAAFPDRRAGGPGDARLARRVADELGDAGFGVRVAREGGRQTVVGERVGTSDRRIVVLAHRDAAERGSAAELSGTAGLLELARVFGAPRNTRRTLVLVSTSGGSAAGARDAAALLAGRVDGVLVLGDLAGTRTCHPLVVPWSNALGATPLRLQRTVQAAVRQEAAMEPGSPRALAQVARFAAPATTSEAGPLLEAGLPAVLLSASGERGPRPGDPVSQERLRRLGRAALATVTALDAGPPLPTEPRAHVLTDRGVLPAWAVRLLVGALLLAPILAAVDALARLRRRREPVAPWARRVLVLAVSPLLALAFARALGLVGLLDAPSAPVATGPPAGAPVALGAVAAVGVLALLGARRELRARAAGPDPGSGAAVVALLLVHSAVLVELWVRDPYAAALFVPAAHLWTLLLVPERRPRRAPALALVAAGLLPALALALGMAAALGVGPADAAPYALALVAGGHASVLAWLELSLLAACAAAAAQAAWRGRARPRAPEAPVTVRGPLTYAGPGSLGGVESALRR